MTAGKTRKHNLVINGYKADDDVIVLGKVIEDNKVMPIRQVGIAGFYVRGLATCFHAYPVDNHH